jgi:hypothetical protein
MTHIREQAMPPRRADKQQKLSKTFKMSRRFITVPCSYDSSASRYSARRLFTTRESCVTKSPKRKRSAWVLSTRWRGVLLSRDKRKTGHLFFSFFPSPCNGPSRRFARAACLSEHVLSVQLLSADVHRTSASFRTWPAACPVVARCG